MSTSFVQKCQDFFGPLCQYVDVSWTNPLILQGMLKPVRECCKDASPGICYTGAGEITSLDVGVPDKRNLDRCEGDTRVAYLLYLEERRIDSLVAS